MHLPSFFGTAKTIATPPGYSRIISWRGIPLAAAVNTQQQHQQQQEHQQHHQQQQQLQQQQQRILQNKDVRGFSRNKQNLTKK